jgi:hypothetical protein
MVALDFCAGLVAGSALLFGFLFAVVTFSAILIEKCRPGKPRCASPHILSYSLSGLGWVKRREKEFLCLCGSLGAAE